ncbi:MAG: 3,4-dihydroxy-2-butanone-4-phosphate synthase [Gammaproteobacteria bacterium]
MVVIVDDEDRENEGDLLMAASMARPQDINFMAKYGRGLICLTLTRERCRQLRLPLMVGATDSSHATNFTISIEASEGVTTGISAYDRAHTVRTAVAPNAVPEDIKQPGHIFPIMAQPGGVLTRAGHTEAGCDLTRLAGLEPAAVIVEILNEDGSMARRADLEKFAHEHHLQIGSIEDLIRYRIRHERTVRRVTQSAFPTEFGEFDLVAYEDVVNQCVHLALSMGEIDQGSPVLTRVHIEDTLGDVLMSVRKELGWPFRDALRRIAREGHGVAVLLRVPRPEAGLLTRIDSLRGAIEQPDDDDKLAPMDLRTIGIGAQILADLGVSKMRLLSAPKRLHALRGFGLEVVDYIWE